MKSKVYMLLAISAGVGLGLLIVRSINTREMLNTVSEEGYETAHDILYPKYSKRGKNLKYGPVLPDSF